ncbi:esterase/lipase family protein [Myxococcus sp. 1LA]
MTSHLVLVPGFGGFDALGSLRYYHCVTEVLQTRNGGCPIHYFPNLPTASVQTRAQALQLWLSELKERRAIGPGDDIHLVGHSTGGLDLRQLLINLRIQQAGDNSNGASQIIKQLRTVQFLSTPHRGTALAHRLGDAVPKVLAYRLFLRLMYEGARGMRGVGLRSLGRALRPLSPRQDAANWIDAIIDTLKGCDSQEQGLPRALARATYFDLLRWLLNMASDLTVITDLDPEPSPGSIPSPAHAEGHELQNELSFIKQHRIRVRSIVTFAPPSNSWPPTLFRILHALTASNPPQRLRQTKHTIHKLLAPEETQTLSFADNDGIVNCVSQVWPDADHSYLIQGDHADVMGHFKAKRLQAQASFPATTYNQYDLLNSPADFDRRRFIRLWKEVDRFTASQQRRECTEPRRRNGASIHSIGGRGH